MRNGRTVIKSDLLSRLKIEGEYVIDAGDVSGRDARMRRLRHQPPEVRARSIIEEARDEAEALVEAANAEADSIRTSAYQEARETALRELEQDKAAFA